MKTFAIGCGLIFSLMCGVAAAADETNTFAVLVTKRGAFTNAVIRSVSAGYAIVIYEGGGLRMPLSELPEPIQKRYATNASPPPVAAANRQGMMSPAAYLQWQKDHAPELLLQQVKAQIGVTQAQIAAFERAASEQRAIAGSAQMPSQRSTITPVTADMFLSQGTPRAARSTLDVYNDQLRDLLRLKDQLEQVVLARQRAQLERPN
jgi:hypothetical protein